MWGSPFLPGLCYAQIYSLLSLPLNARFLALFLLTVALMAHLSATAAPNNINGNNPDCMCALYVLVSAARMRCRVAGLLGVCGLFAGARRVERGGMAQNPFRLKCRDTRLREIL